MHRRSSVVWVGLVALALACGDGKPDAAEVPPEAGSGTDALSKVGPGPHDTVVLDLGDLGTIRAELYPEIAPNSVAHFKSLVEQGFYDGTYFHRVIPEFMIQGGDPYTKNSDPRDDGRGGSDATVDDEFSDYPHRRGTLALANNGYRNSSDSQFFIVHKDAFELDGKYSVLGHVVEGIETVDAVTQLEIDKFGRYGPIDRPYPTSATIESARIEPATEAVSAR